MSDEALAERLPESDATALSPLTLPPLPDFLEDALRIIAGCEAEIRARDARCKLNPSVAAAIVQNIQEGLHYEHASEAAGISYSTFHRWMQWGEDEPDTSAFGALRKAVKTAEALALRESIRDVRQAAKIPRNWAAGMTWAERRHPDFWKRRDDNALQVNLAVAIGVQATDDDRRKMVPVVVIQQSPESLDKVGYGHGLETPSPALELPSGLSPAPTIAATNVQTEAKATPIKGVSPPKVV